MSCLGSFTVLGILAQPQISHIPCIMSRLAAAQVEELTVEREIGPSRPVRRQSQNLQRSVEPSLNGDVELMSLPSVIGREAGERDPLLLRQKVKSEKEIEGFRQCVWLFVVLDLY